MRGRSWCSGSSIQFVLIIAVALVAGLYRDGFPALFPFMRAEFTVSRAALGSYVSLLYLVSAALAVFSGYVVDYLGTKRALLMGAGTLGGLIMVHSLVPTYGVLLLLAVLSGVGFSIIGPGTNKVVTDQFAADRRGVPMGLLFVGWSVGGLLGAVLLPVLGDAFGWRAASVFIGVVMLIMTGIVQLLYRDVGDREREGDGPSAGQKDRSGGGVPSFRAGFRELISDFHTLILCITGFIFGSISGTLAAHYTLFLHLDFGYSEAVAGVGFACLQAGSVAGRPVWGIINDHLLRGDERLGFLLINLSSAAVLIVLALTFRLPGDIAAPLLFIMAFFAGFSGRGWPGVLFAAIARRVDRKSAGMAMGFALVFIRLGITVAPPVFGYVADVTGAYGVSWLLLALLAMMSGTAVYRFGDAGGGKVVRR